MILYVLSFIIFVIIFTVLILNYFSNRKNSKAEIFYNKFNDVFLNNFKHIKGSKKLLISLEAIDRIKKIIIENKHKPKVKDIKEELIEYHKTVVLDGNSEGKEEWVKAVVENYLKNK